MSQGAAEGRPAARFGEPRALCLAAGALAGVVVVLPPLAGLARRYEFVEAVQFSVYAMVVPALVVLAAATTPRPGAKPLRKGAFSERLRHLEPARGVLCLGGFMAAVIAWRTPGAVDAIERHQWLVALQAVSLAAVGVALWRELVGSGPIAPPRPFRAVLAAVAMWTVWVVAYVAGFSATSWYVAFHHFAGRGLSAAADQQFATGVLWLAASLSFMPVVFWNVLAWLRSEDSREVGLGGAVATRGPLS